MTGDCQQASTAISRQRASRIYFRKVYINNYSQSQASDIIYKQKHPKPQISAKHGTFY